MKLLTFMLLLVSLAAAQTTLLYSISPQSCGKGGAEACTFHFPDGSYWASGNGLSAYVYPVVGTVDNPQGVNCAPPLMWTNIPTFLGPPAWPPMDTDIHYSFGCNGTDGNQLMSASITAHAHTLHLCNNHGCWYTYYWQVTAGEFMVTLPATAWPPANTTYVVQ